MPRRTYSSGAQDKYNNAEHVEHAEKIPDSQRTDHPENLYRAAGRASNPLMGIPKRVLLKRVAAFAEEYGLVDELSTLEKGALIAQAPEEYESIQELNDDDIAILDNEKNHRWRLSWSMYTTVILCSIGACVQGWDQTGTAGANLSFPSEFNIPIDNPKAADYNKNNWIVGFVNSSPYMAAFCCSVWLAEPANYYLGRRGTLFLAAIFCFAAPIGSAFTHTWWELVICRLLLGLGVGFKEVTAPILAAENSPTAVRGALTMSWQMWTAFGIFLGYSANLIVHKVGKIAWRLELGSAMIPAIPLLLMVYFVPESPRWYIRRNCIHKAWESLVKLRTSKLQAARDLYGIYVQVMLERKLIGERGIFIRITELFYKNRLRQATLASFVVMIAQQMCGINIIALFSSSVFQEVTGNVGQSMWISWGFGLLNFAFSFPGFYTIDTFGRRALLLATFPNMFWTLLATGLCNQIGEDHKEAKVGLMCLFVYLFVIFYSPGEGPVPFAYSAEVFPLSHRELGMAWAVTVNNTFLALLAVTWFRMRAAMGTTGAFCFYAGLNVLAFIWIYLWVPETKQLSLEELDEVFSIPTKVFTEYQMREWTPWFIQRYIKRDKRAVLVPLLAFSQDKGVLPDLTHEEYQLDEEDIEIKE